MYVVTVPEMVVVTVLRVYASEDGTPSDVTTSVLELELSGHVLILAVLRRCLGRQILYQL